MKRQASGKVVPLPSEKTEIVNSKHTTRSVWMILKQSILPVGFPDSVHHTYLATHIYQFIETTIGNIILVLTAQTLLVSVETDAATLGIAVSVLWTVKDAIGYLTKIAFVRSFSCSFDNSPKYWKIISQLFGRISDLLLILTAVFDSKYWLLLASTGSSFKGFSYAIWASTHASFNQYQAIHNNNIGDITIKEQGQTAMSQVLGMGFGVLILFLTSNPLTLMYIFFGLTVLQIIATTLFVRASNYECLLFTRIKYQAHYFESTSKVANFDEVQVHENWIGEGFVSPVLRNLLHIRIARNMQSFVADLNSRETLNLLSNEKYLFSKGSTNKWFEIYLEVGATGDDLIKAVLHIARLSSGHTTKDAYQWACDNLDEFLDRLLNLGWLMDTVSWDDDGLRYQLPRK